MSEHAPLTEAERIERLLAEHEFDFKGVMVQRDESGKATGYTLACTCGFVYPPDPEVNHHRAHVADILAARTSTATAGEHNCARCSDAPGCFCGWAHWESCPAATTDTGARDE